MKIYKPTTPGQRVKVRVEYKKVLSGHAPAKRLTKGGKRAVGRNNAGRITSRHKGAGVKRVFRDVDFRYDKRDIPATITSVEYDPNRTAFIGLAVYADGEKRYVVLPQKVVPGTSFVVSEKAPVEIANRLPLSKIPIGTFVYNVELKPGAGAKIARSAGNYAEVIAHDAGYVHLKMPSSEVRKVQGSAWATVGEVSNAESRLVKGGKAGRNRWLGKRPTVRGSAMNPVDHPYGGGEGRQGRGLRYAKTRWGQHVGKGQKTRRPKKYSNTLIVRRRQVGKRK
ncbi:MAG TPA: 50S ribosomal protein L2 [Candidatus Paceibacterota bacterium]|nr:50S ribosomal protein L2 [Candidatus Paceibacterota bacterium]